MKIIIEAEPEEIAALVLAVQERHRSPIIAFKGDIRNTAEIIRSQFG